MLSIRMVKICDESLCRPLELIFQSCFENGKFPSEWKKADVVPIYEKNDKQLVKNYRPISLLPIFGKIFEHLIFNKLFHFFSRKQPYLTKSIWIQAWRLFHQSTIGYYSRNI